MSVETVARRYAAALADVVVKTGDAESVQNRIENVGNDDESQTTICIEVFSNPAIAHKAKENLLENLIEKSKPSKTAANFLRVLLRNNRLTELIEINEHFASVLEERSGVVSAKYYFGAPAFRCGKIGTSNESGKIDGQTHSNQILKSDENIIGGVVTRIGSTVYDGSVKTQLEES